MGYFCFSPCSYLSTMTSTPSLFVQLLCLPLLWFFLSSPRNFRQGQYLRYLSEGNWNGPCHAWTRPLLQLSLPSLAYCLAHRHQARDKGHCLTLEPAAFPGGKPVVRAVFCNGIALLLSSTKKVMVGEDCLFLATSKFVFEWSIHRWKPSHSSWMSSSIAVDLLRFVL